jgi:hypothetical protein
MTLSLRLWCAALFACVAFDALAHKPSDSYLRLELSDATLHARWDIALRDLDYAIGIDSDGDGAIRWGEVRAHRDEIGAYALSHLAVLAGDEPCDNTPPTLLIDRHTDGAYASLAFDMRCAPRAPLRVRYSLFFDLDPSHQGLASFARGEETFTTILTPEHAEWRIDETESAAPQQFATYLREGVWHILIGLDHLLFLFSLLLPAVASPTLRSGSVDVVKTVTAFTVAHSITLALAALQVIVLPARVVESTIAASVVFAAMNNLYPMVERRIWAIAFAFGLVHGLGFANVLQDLGLPRAGLVSSLVAFNIGVEIGQLAIVLVVLPLVFAARHTPFYRVAILRAGSAAIALIASVWLVERATGIRVL